MNSTAGIGLVILVAGVVFLVLGMNATESFSEEVREAWTGHYSDRTTWYIVLGIVGIAAGGLMVFLGLRGRHHHAV